LRGEIEEKWELVLDVRKELHFFGGKVGGLGGRVGIGSWI
jgi:hypothetical protein